MNEKMQQKNFDKVLYEKLVKCRSETVITEEEAQRLAKLFSNYKQRYPLTFGAGTVKKVPRDWIL